MLDFSHKPFADLSLRELYDLLALRDRVFVVGQQITAEAVRTIQGISTTITEMDNLSATVAMAVRDQTSATNRIAANVNEASRGTAEVTSNISTVTQATQTTKTSSANMIAATKAMGQHVTRLRDEVRGFLAQVRHA